MAKIIERNKVTIVDYVYYNCSLDDMEALMSYLNSISETSIDNDVRKKISEILVRAYTLAKEGFIEDRIESAIKPKNIGKNIADKIPFEIKIKRKEA